MLCRSCKVGMTHLIVEACVRYWEDALVNEVPDEDGSRIPMRRGDAWCPLIDLEAGRIEGWPQGTTARIHYKVCDGGSYWLGDAKGRKAARWRDAYVPNDILAVGSSGFGDYIIMRVGPDGTIAGWVPPRIAESQWESCQDP